MANLTYKELAQREENQGIESIFKLSYEYIIACIAEEYCKSNSLDINSFTKQNDISYLRVVVYPFFVAMSNGHAESLFNLFAPYNTFSFGPASKPVIELLKKSKKEDFIGIYLSDDERSLTINEKYTNFEQLKTEISIQKINYKQTDFSLSEINIQKDGEEELFSPLTKAISNSITAIRIQSKNRFFNANKEALAFEASYFNEMQSAYLENKTIEINQTRQVLVPPENRPFYYREETKVAVELV